MSRCTSEDTITKVFESQEVENQSENEENNHIVCAECVDLGSSFYITVCGLAVDPSEERSPAEGEICPACTDQAQLHVLENH